MDKIVELMRLIAKDAGVPLNPLVLLPMNIQKNSKSEYHRGVLSCLSQFYYELSQSVDGRKALLDLGLEPFFEDRKGPRHGGADDWIPWLSSTASRIVLRRGGNRGLPKSAR